MSGRAGEKCGFLWQQLNMVDNTLRFLRSAGIPVSSESAQALYKFRGELFGKLGYRVPRTPIQILKLIALSPGSIILWLDPESGWLTEARVKEGAPPIYKAASDKVAIALIKGELTKELELELMTPDTFEGN